MKPTTNWFGKLLRFAGVILIAQAAAAAQTGAAADRSADVSPLLTRCATVSLTSSSGWLSPGLLADTLRKRDEFRNAGLKLVEPDESADIQLTITDEVDERKGFQPVPAGGVHDAYIRAVRARDGRTASDRISALGSYEGIVAGAIIDTLHQVCPAVMRADRVRGSVLETPDPAVVAELRDGRSLAVDSFTYLDDDAFIRRLAARPEMKNWNLAVSPRLADADLRLEIRRLRNSSTWQCQLFDRSHRLLWMHSAGALTEEHAVAGIIDGLIDQIARYRETPVRARAAAVVRPNRVRKGVWRAMLITGDFRTTLQPLVISVDGEHFIARDALGHDVVAIGAAELEDVDRSTVRDAVFQLPPPTYLMDVLTQVAEDERSDPRVVATVVTTLIGTIGAYCASAGALTAVLLPFRPRQHFIEIAFKDGEIERKAMFQLSGKDAGHLLDATRSLIESEKGRAF